jgi:hypothetical protein
MVCAMLLAPFVLLAALAQRNEISRALFSIVGLHFANMPHNLHEFYERSANTFSAGDLSPARQAAGIQVVRVQQR